MFLTCCFVSNHLVKAFCLGILNLNGKKATQIMCTLKLFFEAKQITLEKVLFSVIIWNHPLAVCSPHTGFPTGVENMGEGSSKFDGEDLSQYMVGVWWGGG